MWTDLENPFWVAMLRWLARISKCKHRCMRASISINFKDIRKRTVTREPKSGNNFNVLRRQPHLQHVERRSLFLEFAAQFPRYGIMEIAAKAGGGPSSLMTTGS